MCSDGGAAAALPHTAACDLDMLVETVATAALGAGTLQRWLDLLSADERSRADSFLFAEDRRDYVAAHGLKRALLGRWLGVAPEALRFRQAKRGSKPRLTEPVVPDCDFSITHTRGLVGCAAIMGACIGIDAEPADRTVDRGVEAQVLAPAELAWLGGQGAAHRERSFLRVWTLKEAVLKADGRGLAAGLRDCVVQPGQGAVPPGILALPNDMGTPAAWRLAQWQPAGGYVAALAWRRRTETAGPGSAATSRW